MGCHDEPSPPTGADGGHDVGSDGGVSDGHVLDGGIVVPPLDGGPVEVNEDCGPPLEGPSGRCVVTPGDGNLVVFGNVVTPRGLARSGSVVVDRDGKVACAGCGCTDSALSKNATVLVCRDTLVGPGLINTHEHLTFGNGDALTHGEERFEHRHDWRRGQNGHTELDTPSSGGSESVRYAELRHLFGGATSVNGSGAVPGLLRNLDRPESEGLGTGQVKYETFPLGDSKGERRESGCDYPSIDSPDDGDIKASSAYTPHIAEGIGKDARNEYLCLSRAENGGKDVLTAKTAVIHGIGLLAVDYAMMAAEGAALIWSPRSNLDLYGHTAQVTLASRSGVRIALGTDWPSSGSMNMLRELRCASDYNASNLGGYFSDRALYDMATSGAAAALKVDTAIGSLTAGRFADITIFDASSRDSYRAAIDAENRDVVLVLRGGVPLFGDADLMQALTDSACEDLDVCGRAKRVCTVRETGTTVAAIRAAAPSGIVPLFACGEPSPEPTCRPFRKGQYDGVPTTDDRDGDGVPDVRDDCPSVFNPPRRVDGSKQADADDDDFGDACDPCPLEAASTTCSPPNPSDRDADGFVNEVDNCPDGPNRDQADRDQDGVGDECDACPDAPNPAGAACPASVYAIKKGSATGRVRLSSVVVTAVGTTGYFVQLAPSDAAYEGADFSGVFVYASASGQKPNRGDRIAVEGEVNDFYGQRQLSRSSFTLVAPGEALPDPVSVKPDEVATNGPRAARLEGVLIEVRGVTVTTTMPPAGPADADPNNEFVVDGVLRVNDFLYLVDPFPSSGMSIPSIRGVLRFANGDSKLEPRDRDDIRVPVTLSGIEPSTAFVPAGFSGVHPSGPVLHLTGAATEDMTIAVRSSAPRVVEVSGLVEIRAGGTSAPIRMTAKEPSADAVRIEAEFQGQRVVAEVVVYDDADPRAIESLTVEPTAIPRRGTAEARVTIDFPSPREGVSIRLAVDPPGLASVPISVTIEPGQRSLVFALQAGTSTGTGALIAQAGGSRISADFEVKGSLLRSPRPGDLLITEVHRNPSGEDEKLREWIEVFNMSTDDLTLDGLVVRDSGGSSTITGGTVLSAAGYGVIAFSLDPVSNGGVQAVAEYGPSITLANTDDQIELLLADVSLDLVDWGPGWPGNGQGVSMCLRPPYPSDNNVPESWSNSVGAFGTNGDQGSPGVASSPVNCP